jgi:hypothetical protein
LFCELSRITREALEESFPREKFWLFELLKLRNERPLSLFDCDEELFDPPLLNERIEGPLFDGALLLVDREFELEFDRLSPRSFPRLFLSF